MTHFKHLLTLLLAVTCLQMSARALPNDDGDTPSITFMSGTTTLSDNQKVPNGTLIQLQANNFPEDAAFSYLIGTTAATADDFSSTKKATDDGFIINNAKFLVYQHGIPVFASYTTASQPIVLSVQVSKPTNGTDKNGKVTTTYSPYDGYSTIYTFTLNIDGTKETVAPPTIAPETNATDASKSDPNTNTILTLSESSVTTGDPKNTVFAKYSNKNTYTALQLMAEPNLQLGEHGAGTIGIFSTKTAPARRTTALQVKHNVSYGGNTYDVASDVTVVYYWYTTDRKKAVIKADPEKIETTAEDIKGKTQPINVKFYDAEDKELTNPLDINSLKDYQSGDPVKYTYICNNPEIASVDENGLVTFTGNAGRAYITISTNKVNMFGKDEKGNLDDKNNIGYDAAVTTVPITVTDTRQLMPPIINPDGKKYFKDLKVKVTANTNTTSDINGDAYYVVVDKGTKAPTAEEIVKGNNKVAIGNVGEETLSKRNATVYAVSYNSKLNKYSAISTETFEYVDLQDPVLTPGNKGGIYWYIGKEEDNYQLNVVASTATPNASVYFTINQEGDITDINSSQVHLYSGETKIAVNSGDVVRAVTYLDGVYSNTVTYKYNKQDGGSWSSYSSTSDRVFRNDIQAYIIIGYDKAKNVFKAKEIKVGANKDDFYYLPAYTGVLLYSATLTQAQLLNDGIDGKGISVKGTGGRAKLPDSDLTGNLLIAADKGYKEHISTYDDNGDINMAFNRWSTCVTYDGGKDYYGFFSFYEDNTRKNKNNWRHTAYLKLKKGSPERINFEDNVEQGAKITIVDDEPTAIQTVQQDADKADNAYYTLSGVQVAQPTAPGIYIHNGHKIIIKK